MHSSMDYSPSTTHTVHSQGEQYDQYSNHLQQAQHARVVTDALSKAANSAAEAAAARAEAARLRAALAQAQDALARLQPSSQSQPSSTAPSSPASSDAFISLSATRVPGAQVQVQAGHGGARKGVPGLGSARGPVVAMHMDIRPDGQQVQGTVPGPAASSRTHRARDSDGDRDRDGDREKQTARAESGRRISRPSSARSAASLPAASDSTTSSSRRRPSRGPAASTNTFTVPPPPAPPAAGAPPAHAPPRRRSMRQEPTPVGSSSAPTGTVQPLVSPIGMAGVPLTYSFPYPHPYHTSQASTAAAGSSGSQSARVPLHHAISPTVAPASLSARKAESLLPHTPGDMGVGGGVGVGVSSDMRRDRDRPHKQERPSSARGASRHARQEEEEAPPPVPKAGSNIWAYGVRMRVAGPRDGWSEEKAGPKAAGGAGKGRKGLGDGGHSGVEDNPASARGTTASLLPAVHPAQRVLAEEHQSAGSALLSHREQRVGAEGSTGRGDAAQASPAVRPLDNFELVMKHWQAQQAVQAEAWAREAKAHVVANSIRPMTSPVLSAGIPSPAGYYAPMWTVPSLALHGQAAPMSTTSTVAGGAGAGAYTGLAVGISPNGVTPAAYPSSGSSAGGGVPMVYSPSPSAAPAPPAGGGVGGGGGGGGRGAYLSYGRARPGTASTGLGPAATAALNGLSAADAAAAFLASRPATARTSTESGSGVASATGSASHTPLPSARGVGGGASRGAEQTYIPAPTSTALVSPVRVPAVSSTPSTSPPTSGRPNVPPLRGLPVPGGLYGPAAQQEDKGVSEPSAHDATAVAKARAASTPHMSSPARVEGVGVGGIGTGMSTSPVPMRYTSPRRTPPTAGSALAALGPYMESGGSASTTPPSRRNSGGVLTVSVGTPEGEGSPGRLPAPLPSTTSSHARLGAASAPYTGAGGSGQQAHVYGGREGREEEKGGGGGYLFAHPVSPVKSITTADLMARLAAAGGDRSSPTA